MTETTKTTIQIYMDDGRVFEYDTNSPSKGREHAAKIIATGYRHTEGDDLEWYPPHRIDKVKVAGACESTQYRDRTRAT